MANQQAFPAIELQAPPKWGQSLSDKPAERLEQIAGAAAEARRRVAEGFTTDDLRRELKRSQRVRAWKRFGVVVGVIVALVAAVALTVMLLFSVNFVNAGTMAPALKNGQVVISSKDPGLSSGDVFAYRDGDGVSFGRVIAGPGSWVSIMSDGSLTISETAVSGTSEQGDSHSSAEVKISRQVPVGSYYVLGDAEDATINGLANAEDFVASDQVIGKALFKVWPLVNFGPVV